MQRKPPTLQSWIQLVVITLVIVFLLNGIQPNTSSDNLPNAISVPIITSIELNGKKLVVLGENFDTGALILINGATQKTLYDSRTKLIGKKAGKNLRAGDSLRVRNPDGTSSSEFLYRTSPYGVPVSANDIVYLPKKDRLYASVGSHSLQFADTIVVIDPRSGQIETSIQTGKQPRALALSDDNRSLYVIADDVRIQRIDLNSLRVDFEFSVDLGLESCPFFVSDIQVMPGHPGTVAVATSCSPYSGIAIFDNGVRRPVVSQKEIRANMIRFGSSPDTLWGYNSFDSSFNVTKFIVDSNGVTVAAKPAEGLLFAFNQRIEFSNGLLYSTNGRAVDPEKLTFDGRFLARETITARACALDVEAGRAYFAQRENFDLTMLGFDLKTYRMTEFYRAHYGIVGDAQNHMVRCGAAGLALIADGKIAIFPLSLLKPVPPYERPQPVPINTSVRRIPLPNYTLAYDTNRQFFYASVPSVVGGFGNCIVPINPMTGTVGDPVWAGSEPWQMAVSDDGQFLYTVLFGSRAIRRLRLPELTPDLRFPLFSDEQVLMFRDAMSTTASEILTVPGKPESVIVARWGDHNNDPFDPDGVAVYDNGVKRPASTPSWPFGPPTNTIQLSASGDTLYALNTQNTNFTFTRMGLDSSGVHIISSTDEVGDSGVTAMKCQSGLCFTNTGLIINPETQTRIDRFRFDSVEPLISFADFVLPDVSRNRVYFIVALQTGIYIKAFDLNTRKQIASFKVPGVSGPIAGFWQWGNDQFAFSTGNEIVFFPNSLLQPTGAQVSSGH